ncbi:MAG: alpha-galactosidase [Porticoccaceae bacterium]|nr:alpha-galactosidase [Porticoccaceae bacterium]
MTKSIESFYTLNSSHCSLVVDCRGNAPAILYWGPLLADATNPEMLALVATRQELQACQPQDTPIALSPQAAAGFMGSPGVQVHRNGQQWAVFTQLYSVSASDNGLVIVSRCQGSDVELTHCLRLHKATDVLSATTAITNTGASTLWVDRCDAPCIPVPMHYTKIAGFTGRWANEFQMQTLDRFAGAYVRENRSGRTSHDAFPGVIVHEEHTNEQAGAAYGLHLGWSGNHHLRIEEQHSGQAYAQLGELFYPGEMSLEPGQMYCSPILFGASTAHGLSALSASFHGFVRSTLTDQRVASKARPVHFNTWEAVYFDLSFDRLCELADSAAEVGTERFVLDDGWFKNRKSDSAGLGDWFVDEVVFPQGLVPLIDYVQAQHMEFGLWVEPEMVNPDSDLYRAHPEWVLNADPAPLILSRHQLVLDLTRVEVQTYLFERLDALLTDYAISYLKWDMNRALHQPGNQHGRAVTHNQTSALYQLLKRLRAAHPMVEIESCSSGGGRADFGILAFTDRIWTSDSNDALDRLSIQKGFSMFFPPEVMGAHIGPSRCHATGRVLSMDLRAGAALFGHMGIEANLLDMDEAEKQGLKAAVALHKQHRQLLHSGRLVRLDTLVSESSFGVVAADGAEAIFSYAQLDSLSHSVGGRLRFASLDQNSGYTVNVVWPLTPSSYSKSILDVINGAVISGDVLVNAGIQLPIMLPGSMLIFHLSKKKPEL